jgi:hypothetical protein
MKTTHTHNSLVNEHTVTIIKNLTDRDSNNYVYKSVEELYKLIISNKYEKLQTEIKNSLVNLTEEETKKQLKLSLPCFISNITQGLTLTDVTDYTNVVTLDIDKKDNTHLVNFDEVILEIWENLGTDVTNKRTNITTKVHNSILMYQTMSGGYRLLVNTCVKNENDYNTSVNYLIQLIYKNFNVKIDASSAQPNHKMVIFSDKQAKFRDVTIALEVPKNFKNVKKETNNTKDFTKNRKRVISSVDIDIQQLQEIIEQIHQKCDKNTFAEYSEWIKLGYCLISLGLTEKEFCFLSSTAHNYNKQVCIQKFYELEQSFDESKAPKIQYFLYLAEKLGVSLERKIWEKHKYKRVDTERIIEEIFTEYKYSYDTFTAKEYVNEKEIDEIHVNVVCSRIKNKFRLDITKRYVGECITSLAIKNTFCSVNNLLNKLDTNVTYNSINPIDFNEFQKLCKELGLSELEEKMLFRYLLGCFINFTNENGNKYYDEILILQGEQGVGKTWFVKNVLTKYFSLFVKKAEYSTKKDDRMKQATSLFLFDDELSSLSRNDSNIIKQLTSETSFDERLPYAAKLNYFTRRYNFIGCTNNNCVYNDLTGGRRFLVINLKNYERGIEKRINMEKIWGFFYRLHMDGYDYNFYDINIELKEKQEEVRYISTDELILGDMIEVSNKPTLLSNLITEYNQFYPYNKLTTTAWGLIMKKNNIRQEIKKINKKTCRLYYCKLRHMNIKNLESKELVTTFVD